MPSLPRFARLSLAAALAAPSLILLPRTAHPFNSGAELALPVLALLAAGLAWLDAGAPWRRAWTAAVGLSVLAWAAFELLQVNRVALLTHWVVAPLRPRLIRATLAAAALALGWEAWRAGAGGLDRRLRRAGLALGALWALSGALSLRPDAAAGTLLGWGAYGLVFFAAHRLLDSPARRRAVLLLLLLAGAVNAVYALLQVAGLDPVAWSRSFGGRAIGFFGNPNFLGGHLALLLPLALALALDGRGSRLGAALRWLLAALLAAGLLVTQTRGAWAGAAVGCALVLGLAARRAPDLLRRRRRVLVAAGLAGLLGLGAFFTAQPRALARVADVLAGRDVEAGRRAFLMRKSLQLAAAHPLLGVGPGNFRILFPSVQVRGLEPARYDQQPYVVSEHSHNDLLQMAADAGWAAAALWLLLLAWTFQGLWRGAAAAPGPARSHPELLPLLGVLGGLAALTVHGLANFPFLILSTQSVAFALAGLGLRAAAPPAAAAGPDLETEPTAAPPRPAGLPPRAAAALLLAALAALAVAQGRGMVMEQYWWVGEGELGLRHPEAASEALIRALAFDRDEDRLWKLHGRSEMDRQMVWNSIGSLREAHRLNPWDAEAAVLLGRACIENKLFGEAETVLSGVVDYAPNLTDVWEPLAAAAFNQGHYDAAVKAYDWMIYYRLNLEAAYANKAAAQGSQGRLPEALLTLHQGEQALPGSGKLQLNLAITYLKLGMRAKAREAWARAAQLIPGDPQVDQLRSAVR